MNRIHRLENGNIFACLHGNAQFSELILDFTSMM
jgi:hypothetical protein